MKLLLSKVARRLGLTSAGARFYVFVLALFGLYAALLATARLLSLIPDLFHPALAAVPPLLAVALALVFHRRATLVEAARAVDAREQTRDLFLTAAMIERTVGELQPLVLKAAEARAAAVDPRKVVPYRWQRRAPVVLAVAAGLAAATAWLPSADPFGRGATRRRDAERREKLADTRKATAMRLAALAEQAKTGRAAETERKLEELKQTLDEMKPKDKAGNLQRLKAEQKDLGAQWKKLSEEKLRKALEPVSQQAQQFGGTRSPKTEEWKKGLQEGNADGIRKELEDLQKEAKRLADAPPSAEKEAAQRRLEQKLKELAEALKEGGTSQPLQAALDRALSQLEMAGLEGLSKEALEALADSLDLAESELDDLERLAKDLKKLEEALKTLQMAKRLNEDDGLG